MANEEKTGVNDRDLREAIVESLQKSGKPLTLKHIAKGLPKMYRVSPQQLAEVIADLGNGLTVYSWGKTRGSESFFTDPPEKRAKAALLAVLTEPLPKAKLQERAAKRLPGLAKTQRDKLLKQLIGQLLENGEAIKHRPSGERIGPAAVKSDFEDAFARLLEQHQDATLEQIEEVFARVSTKPAPAQKDDLAERIQKAIVTVEPEAKAGALASLAEVRRQLDPPASKEEFDQTVLDLVRDGTLSVHEFMGYLQISEDERAELVFNGQEYYGGVTFRP